MSEAEDIQKMHEAPLVVCLGTLPPNFEILVDKKFSVSTYQLTSKEQFINDLRSGRFENLFAIYAAWLAFGPLPGGLTKDIIEEFPKTTKIITVCSAGFGGVDLEALRSKGISFCNTPTVGAGDVADTVLHHVLEGFRRYSIFESELRNINHTIKTRSVIGDTYTNLRCATGALELNYNSDPIYQFGHVIGSHVNVISPKNRKVTIVGFGAIGKEVGKRLNAIGMKIQYIKRTKLTIEEESELGYDVEFCESVEKAVESRTHCIVLCLPGTPENKWIINKKIIDKMNGVILINVGRGSLVNEEDLLAGLRNGRISFAGLDVYATEPYVNEELISRRDVSLTPHIGSSTVDNFEATAEFCLNNIIKCYETGTVDNLQN
ncbi:hypothetical protein CANARDRAFT_25945 [[Candida] arabinofermentans NRRL YB-2248]|uniref:D-isomer specific 2-hydroxyacid dehydrogenase NAD-binding domain-containing protein n=1 Tax=[Candida] arabinofermentans NRRL YB-2248 TaxID=983967 RepID=A0A1E4T7H5_9ASCO|nr:hypothetical protein CANARDRAFT_25945 [[Candida] arabinofermentans NRRL YB-2248]